jgi:hypothetical protein
MNCAECKELLVVHLEGLLEDSRKQAVEGHLNECETCRAELEGLQTLHQRLVGNGKALAHSDLENEVMNRIIREQSARLKAASQAGTGLRLRRLIMKSPITKLAAAAVFIAIVGLSITFLTSTESLAYALDQTIQANHSVRYLHIKYFPVQHEDEPKEFWIACDDQGRIDTARYHLPDWASGNDGTKWIVWSQGVVKVWFHKKNSFLICRDESVPKWILELVQTSDPLRAIEHVYELEHQGKMTVEIEQPRDKSKPIIVRGTYVSDGQSPSRREVFHVDQATKLVTVIEYYHRGTEGEYVYDGRQELSDYNVEIAPEMFALDDEVPADVMRVDQVVQVVGLAQGTMSDEEVAVETVRQFFEALKAGDYETAGLLMGGIPAEKIQEWFGRMKIVGIVSIGEPQPHSNPGVGGFVVPCKVEMENPDGTRFTKQYPGVCVRPVDVRMQPDRWNIHGGI